MLPPHQRRVLRVLDRVLAHVRQHRRGPVRTGGADTEHERRRALAGRQADHLVHLAVDAAELVEDREGEVQALEPFRHRGQHLERRVPRWDDQLVLEHLHPRFQVRVQLHHSSGDVEAQPGLPFVAGGHDDRRAVGAEQQVVQAERGDGRGLALTPRQIQPVSRDAGSGSSTEPNRSGCQGRSRSGFRAPWPFGTVM
jgi:hypothetical protein